MDHADGGGFAGSVGAEDAEAFAFVDLEVDGVDGGEVAVALGQGLGLEDWGAQLDAFGG